MAVALLGIAVSGGTAIGKARILRHGLPDVVEYVLPRSAVEDEIYRFRRALETARRQLHAIKGRIPAHAPGDIAAFIDTHLLMLEDATLCEDAIEIIRTRRCNAEWALKLQTDALIRVFNAMDDPYLKTRRDDVEHVVRRVQQILLHEGQSPPHATAAGRIVLADNVSPAELVLLHHQKIAGLATERGGLDSHTAIMARSLGLPALVGVPHTDEYIQDDEPLVLDGSRGVLLAGLDTHQIAYYRRRQKTYLQQRRQFQRLKNAPAVTRDGTPIELQANVELPGDFTAMKRVGVDSVGLFRTEFMFMNNAAPPGEQEQFGALRRALKRLGEGVLTVRSLDLGADKHPIAGFDNPGPNPALGLRAIRLCLKDTELFLPQLRAILRASAYGRVRLLLPMLTNITELTQALEIIESVKRELSAARLRFDPAMPIGAMIELPAAALCASAFARRLDFLSIGTNDLIQYTLAADRMDQDVSHLYDPLHPAILRLIKLTLDAGEQTGTPVAMCGEMAGNIRYTRLLLGLGLTRFSIPPPAALEVKEIIATSRIRDLKLAAAELLDCEDPLHLADRLGRLNRRGK